MDVEWECHWTSRDKEGEWRKDADDDTNAKERLPCPCHHATRQSPCHAIARQWANRQEENEGPRRRRLRARLASCSTLCLHRLKLFMSRYADYFMLFSLDYSYSIIKWSLTFPSMKLSLNLSNTLGKTHQPKGKGMSPSSARARRTPTRPNSTLM